MKRLFLACLLTLTMAAPALAMDLHKGFGAIRWGQTCRSFVNGPSWAIERARPVWDPQVQMFGMIEQYLADHGLTDTVLLTGSRCEDRCTTGPNIRIDGQLYGEVTGERLLELLSRHLSA